MERVMNGGAADFISICRPLINEPNFPNLMRYGVSIRSGCLSSNNCWVKEMDVGIACKCPVEKIA
jgi:2,4-dienoyl-CoA reductase-like NADH-dependent reductase (Old Yellow Enzyme family)